MTTVDEQAVYNDSAAAPLHESEMTLSRRSLIRFMSPGSLSRKFSLASASLFAGLAARGTTSAIAHAGYGSSPACCLLANLSVSCQTTGSYDFACDHGGTKYSWVCCHGRYLWKCGECNVNATNCWGDEDTIYKCSWAAVINQNQC